MTNSAAQASQRTSNQSLEQNSHRNSLPGIPSTYKRAYKACESCRKTKAKCELDTGATACSKCTREQKDCVFPPHRSTKRVKLSKEPSVSNETAQSVGTNDVNPPINTQDLEQTDNTMSNNNGNAPSVTPIPTRNASFARSSQRKDDLSEHNAQTNTAVSGSLDQSQSAQTMSGQQGQDFSGLTDLEAIPSDILQRDVMQTFVTNSKDAIGLLFRAAEQIDSEDSDEQQHDGDFLGDGSAAAGSIYNIQSPSMPSPGIASTETLDLWDQHRFVRQGWFTAREAVTYLEFFFRNLSPLSPLADSYYADHKNHKRLILEEPLLCCTLLMIASRHYTPANSSLKSRADFIHIRLWRHVEHLIQKITFGSEKYSVGKTRTLGSIQALLLIIEWHPRALHFPPETDGWDSSLAPSIDDTFQPNARKTDAGRRWREDVFEPAKRSDRMSWMLVGIATTLAHELGVFDHLEDEDGHPDSASKRKTLLRTRRLLFLYASQLSLRLGCTTVFPQVNHQAITYTPDLSTSPQEQPNQDREIMISKWIEITKLLTTATEMFFASPSATRQMFRSSRYVSLLDHFQPLLTRWYNEFSAMDCPTIAEPAKQILLVDYHYVRMYINSIAIQALVERASSYNSGDIWLDQNFLRSEFAQDFRFVKEVRDSSANILAIATKLAEDDILQLCPVRLFLRIVSASIFLLKTISLGSREGDIVSSLGQLERCIEALQNGRADDVHLSSRYAMLIARHVRRFKRNFRMRKSGAQHSVGLRTNEAAPHATITATVPGVVAASTTTEQTNHPSQQFAVSVDNEYSRDKLGSFNDRFTTPFFDFDDGGAMQDWLAQPFSSQVAPFGTDWLQPASGLAVDSLDFLWNMST